MEKVAPRRVLVAAAVVLGVIWAVIFAVAPRDSARTAQEPIASVSPSGGLEPVFRIDVTIEAVDALKETMRVRVETTVVDPAAAGEDWIVFSLLPNRQVIRPGNEVVPVPVTDDVPISGGGIDDYPWDGYGAVLLFAAGQENKAKPLQSAATMPIRVDIHRRAADFEFRSTELHAYPNEAELDLAGAGVSAVEGLATGAGLEMTRSPAPRGWAQVGILMLWLVALGVAAVAVSVLTGWRPYESSRQLAWVSATMFALVAFRGTLPGNPPIGVFFDWVSYFWAVGIVAASLVALIVFGLATARFDVRGQKR